MNIIFRTAELSDIKQMQVVRHLVKESPFYLYQGSTCIGSDPNGEIKFELSYNSWPQRGLKKN